MSKRRNSQPPGRLAALDANRNSTRRRSTEGFLVGSLWRPGDEAPVQHRQKSCESTDENKLLKHRIAELEADVLKLQNERKRAQNRERKRRQRRIENSTSPSARVASLLSRLSHRRHLPDRATRARREAVTEVTNCLCKSFVVFGLLLIDPFSACVFSFMLRCSNCRRRSCRICNQAWITLERLVSVACQSLQLFSRWLFVDAASVFRGLGRAEQRMIIDVLKVLSALSQNFLISFVRSRSGSFRQRSSSCRIHRIR